MASEKVMYIHIPTDILEESSPYRCPTTVNLELRDQNNSRRRSVGAYPPLSSRTTDSLASTIVYNGILRENQGQSHANATPDGPLRGRAIGTTSVVGSPRKKLPTPSLARVMDSDDGELMDTTGTPDGLDLIEAVAQANDVSDSTGALPRLQSSPCPIHSRSYQQQHHLPLYRQQQLQQRNFSSLEPRNDILYSTNCHGGQVRRSTSQASGNSGRRSNKSNNSGDLRRQEEERIKVEREQTFKQDVMTGRSQKYFRPMLPNEMPAQDFVSSWLMHGSEPEGRSHFPELLPNTTDGGLKDGGLPMASDSNRGKKQTLKPIQTMTGEYAKGLRGSSIVISDNRPK